MSQPPTREEFDTALRKIRHEIKSRLVAHGLFGNITNLDVGSVDPVPEGATIEIEAKGRSVSRSFDRRQIEDCRLRVGGPVLTGIIAMIAELAA